jgi:hypothetical protein
MAPSAETATALWAYGVVEAGASFPDSAGLGPIRELREGHLAVLVSAVPLDEYGEATLPEHLNDLDWLGRVARAHQGVQSAARHIVPLRLCTLYRDEESARQMLREEAPKLTQALERLREHSEWGVKLFVDTEAMAATSHPDQTADTPGNGGSAGLAYLARRRREREDTEQLRDTALRCAHDCHTRLAALSDDARQNRPQAPELHGRRETMVLNGAYLVADGGARDFAEEVSRLAEQYEPLGATLELTGPWPAYNFVEGR